MRFEKIMLEKYAWSIGTTSFRVENLRELIPEQLKLLNELNGEYLELDWNETKQTLYSELLTKKGLFEISKTLAKDARVKTSALAELGLTTEKRSVTRVGNNLINFFETESVDESKNIFLISEDSFVYLKQLLKYQTPYSEFKVKPFLVLLYLCSKFEDGLKMEYFTYMLPLCKNKNDVNEVVEWIENQKGYIEFLVKKILVSEKTQQVKEILETYKDLSEDEILALFPHGKGVSYVRPILELYSSFLRYKELSTTEEKYEVLKNLNFSSFKSRSLVQIKEFLFGVSNLTNNLNKENIIKKYESSCLGNSKNILYDLYVIYTLSSYLANLIEYQDLHLRYFKLADIFIIDSEKIELDIIPKFYFKKIQESLLDVPILSYELYREKLEKSEKLSEIYEFMDFDINILKDEIIRKYPSLREKDFEEEIKTLISDEKEQKFKKLIETKFKKENLVKLLKHLNEGNLKKLKEFGFDTSLPTILEYLIGISWYLISEKEGKIYNIFNLKLDSNLLPIRFASGGQADLIYKYSDGHDVLLEATMTQKDNQRKLELEPVPRHLGRYRMDVNDNAYTIFIAPNLDPNVLVNFRAMKELPYYNPSNLNKINGLKIIPLSLENLIYILNSNLHYSKLREDFEKYYQLEEKNGYVWFENTINIEYL